MPDPQGTGVHGSGINHMAGLHPFEGRGLAFYAPRISQSLVVGHPGGE